MEIPTWRGFVNEVPAKRRSSPNILLAQRWLPESLLDLVCAVVGVFGGTDIRLVMADTLTKWLVGVRVP